jgi:hypothetical protein
MVISSCHEKRPTWAVPSHAPPGLAGLYAPNTAPCGSWITANRPVPGMSWGPTMTLPPNDVAFAAVSSTLLDSTYGIQLGVTPCCRISSVSRNMPAIGTPPFVHIE